MVPQRTSWDEAHPGTGREKKGKREKDILDPKIIMTFVDEVFYFLSGNYLNFC